MTTAETFRKAQRELVAVVRRTGHRIEVPKALTENFKATCRACGKTVAVRFDVPCGWLVVGDGSGAACHCGRGF